MEPSSSGAHARQRRLVPVRSSQEPGARRHVLQADTSGDDSACSDAKQCTLPAPGLCCRISMSLPVLADRRQATKRTAPAEAHWLTGQPADKKRPSWAADAAPQPRSWFSGLWTPSLWTAFQLLTAVRMCGALWTPIGDCDESFNYWEPLHYVLHGSGFQTWEYSPMYAIRSYAYVLLHALPLLPVRLLLALLPAGAGFAWTKVHEFYTVRCALSIVSALADACLYAALLRHCGSAEPSGHQPDRQHSSPSRTQHAGAAHACRAATARWFLFFSVLSTGAFTAAGAFLPSSFCMCCVSFAWAAWLAFECPSPNPRRPSSSPHLLHLAVFAIALASLVAWPFAAILGLPLAIYFIFANLDQPCFAQSGVFSYLCKLITSGFWPFARTCFILLLLIALPQIAIDSYFYGRLVVAPLNIVMYNVFPALARRWSGGGEAVAGAAYGPDLYGTEPWTFYLANGVLNWSVAFPMALLWPAALALGSAAVAAPRLIGAEWGSRLQLCLPTAAALRGATGGLLLWVAVFFTRPHKEERFLFPIYPLFALCAAMLLAFCSTVLHLCSATARSVFARYSLKFLLRMLQIAVLVLFALSSASRTILLYRNYHAPVDIYLHVAHMPSASARWTLLPSQSEAPRDAAGQQTQVKLVCVGKEWHRFQSSFFLPPDRVTTTSDGDSVREQWRVGFVRSGFLGQLPKAFPEDIDLVSATRAIPSDMNDMNREETSRYVENPAGRCHWLVDLEEPEETGKERREGVVVPQEEPEVWQSVGFVAFAVASNSSRLFRSYYVPSMSDRYCQYGKYRLWRNRRLVLSADAARRQAPAA